jgi:hypothetical protein
MTHPEFDARAQAADAQRFAAGLERDMAHAGWMPKSGIYACGCSSSVPPPLLDDEDDDLGFDPFTEVHDTSPCAPPEFEP